MKPTRGRPPAMRRAVAFVAVILLIADKTRVQAISGLILVLIGVPVYFLWRAVEGRPAAADAARQA